MEREPDVMTLAEPEVRARIQRAARRLGIGRLRPEQARAIANALAGRDVLIVLPTGFGKSACYQIPAMVLPAPAVLISPLVALLEDQRAKLEHRGIPSIRIDGTVRGRRRELELARIASGGSVLVMTTPESFGLPAMRAALSSSGIALVAIDEAHCISEWGHDFRPAYLRIAEHIQDLGAPPIMALTATAKPNVRTDIIQSLGMRDPIVAASSPHRKNLAFAASVVGDRERLRSLWRLSKKLGRPGLIYCTTTKRVDEIYVAFRRAGLPVHRYHGRMTSRERRTEQEAFMRRGRRTIMIATSAFGLGIDKADIRYVIHAQAPGSLEQYVQEAGRAGRDGRIATCILLFDPSDRAVHEALLSKSRTRPDQLRRLAGALRAWAEEGRRPTLEALSISAGLGPRITSALTSTLRDAGLLRWSEDHVEALLPWDRIEPEARRLAVRFETLRLQDARRLDAIEAYASAGDCRARFLGRYFGELEVAPCGLCDQCRRERAVRPGRPALPPGKGITPRTPT